MPLETPLLAAARARGLAAVDGLGMLLHQAVPGFEKWFGVRPEVTAELRALIERDIEGGVMLVIGLTGSIGMGKSTVAARLRALGIAVCDADAEVHKLYEGAAVPPIEAAFPGTTAGGKVDRQKLAAGAARPSPTSSSAWRPSCIPWCSRPSAPFCATRRPRARRWPCWRFRCCWRPAASAASTS